MNRRRAASTPTQIFGDVLWATVAVLLLGGLLIIAHGSTEHAWQPAPRPCSTNTALPSVGFLPVCPETLNGACRPRCGS